MKLSLLAFLALFLSALIYGSYSILFRVIGYNLPLYFQSAVRNALIVLILLVFIRPLKQIKRINKHDFSWIFFRTFAGCVTFITFYLTINLMEIGTVYFVFYSSATIFSYLVGKIIFQELITKVKAISLALALVGLFIIYSFKVDLDKFFYLLLVVISGSGWAFWTTFSKKISSKFTMLDLTFFDALISALLFLTASLIAQEKWVMPNFSVSWLANYLLGLLMIATSLLVLFGFKHLEAQLGSLVMLNEIVFGVLVGWLFYQEVLPLSSYLGGLLIVIAAVLPKLTLKFLRKKTGIDEVWSS